MAQWGWPKWLAWASAILAVGSISPVAYLFVGIDAIWIVVVSIWLFSKARQLPNAEYTAP